MRKFSRGLEPTRLTKIKNKKNTRRWDDLSRSEEGIAVKEEIRNALCDAQHGCCAYCEVRLKRKSGKLDAHIEHLRRRSDNPKLEFDWENLFLSCCNTDSCGRFKDYNQIVFNVEDIIDPSKEDPQDFFEYSVVDGRILTKKASERNMRRSQETIRVFNLSESQRLKGIRGRIAIIVGDFLKTEPSAEDVDDFLTAHKESDCFSVYCFLLQRKTQDFDRR